MSISEKDRRTIFALARELRLDDAGRQEVQLQVTGKSSTSTMTPLDAGKLIAHLRRLVGPAPARRYPPRAGRPPNTLNREPMLKKIEALLADMGLSWQYAESIAWRITGGKGTQLESQPGVERLEWVTDWRDLRAVIAALHVEHKKRQQLARVMEELQRVGKDVNWLEKERLPAHWAGHWQRNPKRLERIIEILAGIQQEAQV